LKIIVTMAETSIVSLVLEVRFARKDECTQIPHQRNKGDLLFGSSFHFHNSVRTP